MQKPEHKQEDFEKTGLEGIESKWQKKWEKEKIFEADRDEKRKKYFLIFAYPGVSGYLHVGHLRSYTYPDIIARYKRMLGYNVLFPAGFHASGLPSVSFADKIAKGDVAAIEYLKHYGVSDKDIEKLKDPNFVVEFFSGEYIRVWKQLGYSIDFRRTISTINPNYSKFMEWQFKKLNQLGLLVKKPHYAPYCPKCGPVAVDPSETDISKGGNAEILEFTIIKYRCGDYILPCATLRPETIFGVVNIWIHPDIEYVVTNVGTEKWLLSEEAAEKLSQQMGNVKISKEKIKGGEFIGKNCTVPFVNREVPILEATFVSSAVGTGIVMSVPAHAPYDWIALEDAKKVSPLAKNIQAISIIKTKDFGEFPAKDLIEKFSIKNQSDLGKLDAVTEEVYTKEFHQGLMRENCGELSGMPVSRAKDTMKENLLAENLGAIMYEFSEEVVCRCNEKVFVKMIPDQWFIKYSDSELKDKAHDCGRMMTIVPDEYKTNIHTVLDWYNDRACTRKGKWLGTRLPFDKEWIIEPIADSTLYPATYLLSKYTNSKLLKPEQLTEEFFDCVFLGKGNPKEIASKLKISPETVENFKKDFEYWYPLDMNFGGKEHQSVHFPVFVFNHVAVFPEKNWPKGIFVNWWVSGKGGGKISKSKGGADPIMEVVAKYTSDSIRLYYAHIGSPHMDIEWEQDLVMNYKKRITRIFQLINELQKISSNEEKDIDKWILSRLNSKIKKAKEFMDDYKIREASIEIFYWVYSDVMWWLKRGGNNKKTAKEISAAWIRLMAPFTPFMAEELWERAGNKNFVSIANYPEADESAIDEKANLKEEVLTKLMDDIQNILKVTEAKPKKIFLYPAPDWKRKAISLLKEKKTIQDMMKEPSLREHGQEIASMLKSIRANEIPNTILTLEEENEALNGAKEFLEKEFNSGVHIEKELKYDPKNRAKFAQPMKPGIYIEG